MSEPGANIDFDASQLDFEKGGGHVIVIAQDAATGAVLMVAHADREAVERTVRTGEMHYTSRTRGLWRKGATSGNVQHVVSLRFDCDRDAILALVNPTGPSCHTGSPSCFGDVPSPNALSRLAATIERRTSDSADDVESYTKRLLNDRNLRLKKLGEEASELAVACADNDRDRVMDECADLFYHALVAARPAGVKLDDVLHTLAARTRHGT